MSENSDAKTWLEAAQQVLGVSFGQLIGLLLPAGLGCWYWSMSTTPERELWPALTPFEWIAEASENVGVSGSWALDISAWIGERPDWFWRTCSQAERSVQRPSLSILAQMIVGMGTSVTQECHSSNGRRPWQSWPSAG